MGERVEVGRRLTEIVDSVRRNPLYSQRIECVLDKINVQWSEVLGAVLTYTIDLHEVENIFYEDIRSRMAVYVHALVAESYQRSRAMITVQYLERVVGEGAREVLDMGFGVPGIYLEHLLWRDDVRFTLADRDPGAMIFGEAVLDCAGLPWRDRVAFAVHDMDDGVLAGDYDVYMFMDSIEHAADPAAYLRQLVKLVQVGVRFIMALPIGKCSMAMHFVEWLSVQDAQSWLESCGLIIEQTEVVFPTSGVDLFADTIEGGFCNLLVLCRKERP